MRYLFAVSAGCERMLVMARAIWDVVVVKYGSLPESVMIAVWFLREVPRRPTFKVCIMVELASVQHWSLSSTYPVKQWPTPQSCP
jgi:hypothetical protein